ncbi:interleukin-15 [Triplophysa dalaica]|uniref:interleukin-15 n=1 Tax=Triplophysa dalaica TaxID=1582913 RepID=UPI0024DF8694|nr:interleukin-15 [Triplophysa dalaica]
MILMTICFAIIVGFRNKPPKLKTMRIVRCGCNPWCIETHLECPLNSEVWNSFLILSCLSALMPVADSHKIQALIDLKNALNQTRAAFERSDASLYAPNIESINKCTNKFFDCYLLEMNVVLHEEKVTGINMEKVEATFEEYKERNCSSIHPCEAEELTTSVVFYERMKTFLEKLTVLCQDKPSESSCD